MTKLSHGDTIEITGDDTLGQGLTFRVVIKQAGRYTWSSEGYATERDAFNAALDWLG